MVILVVLVMALTTAGLIFKTIQEASLVQLSSPGNRITDDEVLDNAFIEVDRVLGTTYLWSCRPTTKT